MMFIDSKIQFSFFQISQVKALSLALLMLLISPVFAGEKINRSLDTAETAKIKICNDRGSISINVWDKNEVLVKGEIDDLADKFVFEKKDDFILIEVELTAKHAHGKNNGKGSKFEVWLPKKHDMQFNGIATDILLNGLAGDVNINSVSGNVNAKSVEGNLRIKNISGKVLLNDISGRIDVSTVSGKLEANVKSSNIKVKAISSDIIVVTDQIDNISLFSISGNTKLSGELSVNGKIKLENVSGDSYFFYNDIFDARISMNTGPDGSIINRIRPFERKKSHLNSQQQHYVEGEASAKVTMLTVSGKVGLKNISEINKRKKR